MPSDEEGGLEDEQLRQEIDLLAELIVAAAAAGTERLPDTQIDAVLGATRPPP